MSTTRWRERQEAAAKEQHRPRHHHRSPEIDQRGAGLKQETATVGTSRVRGAGKQRLAEHFGSGPGRGTGAASSIDGQGPSKAGHGGCSPHAAACAVARERISSDGKGEQNPQESRIPRFHRNHKPNHQQRQREHEGRVGQEEGILTPAPPSLTLRPTAASSQAAKQGGGSMPGGKAANFLQANLARGRGVKMVWLARRRDRSGEKGWADEVDWRTNEGGAPVGSEGDGAEDLAAGPALRSGHGAAGGRRAARATERGTATAAPSLTLSLLWAMVEGVSAFRLGFDF